MVGPRDESPTRSALPVYLWPALLAILSSLLVSSCGMSGDPAAFVNGDLPSNHFCGDLQGVLEELGDGRRDAIELRRLAGRLDVDAEALRRVHDLPVATAATTLANAVRGGIMWSQVGKALDDLADDVCKGPTAFKWAHAA